MTGTARNMWGSFRRVAPQGRGFRENFPYRPRGDALVRGETSGTGCPRGQRPQCRHQSIPCGAHARLVDEGLKPQRRSGTCRRSQRHSQPGDWKTRSGGPITCTGHGGRRQHAGLETCAQAGCCLEVHISDTSCTEKVFSIYSQTTQTSRCIPELRKCMDAYPLESGSQ